MLKHLPISEDSMKVTFTGDYNTFFKPANTPFKELIEEASWRGTDVTRIGSNGQITVNDVQDLTITVLMAIINAGMEVYGYECFIKIPSANIDDAIDLNIAGAEGKTWREWGIDANSTAAQDAEGNYYLASNAYNSTPLTAADLKLINDASINLVTSSEYKVIFSER